MILQLHDVRHLRFWTQGRFLNISSYFLQYWAPKDKDRSTADVIAVSELLKAADIDSLDGMGRTNYCMLCTRTTVLLTLHDTVDQI